MEQSVEIGLVALRAHHSYKKSNDSPKYVEAPVRMKKTLSVSNIWSTDAMSNCCEIMMRRSTIERTVRIGESPLNIYYSS